MHLPPLKGQSRKPFGLVLRSNEAVTFGNDPLGRAGWWAAAREETYESGASSLRRRRIPLTSIPGRPSDCPSSWRLSGWRYPILTRRRGRSAAVHVGPVNRVDVEADDVASPGRDCPL